MQRFVILAALVALASAGGRVLSPEESRAILQIHASVCGSGRSGPEERNGRWYYCKNGPASDGRSESTKEINIPQPKPVTIFIDRPGGRVQHTVHLTGSQQGQDTQVIVLPQTPEVDVQVIPQIQTQKKKPEVLFLTSGGSGGSSSASFRAPETGGYGRFQRSSSSYTGLAAPAPPPQKTEQQSFDIIVSQDREYHS